LRYLTLFRSEEALSLDIASDHIREIGARLAEIAMLMPSVETARAAERAASRRVGRGLRAGRAGPNAAGKSARRT